MTTTTFTPSTSLPIGLYRIWARANLAGGGHSPWSAPADLHVNTRAELNVLPIHGTDPRPTISWSELPGAVRYDMWVNNVTTGESQVLRNTDVTGTSLTPDQDLEFGRYHIWIRGIDALGRPAAWSELVEYSLGPQPLNPANPTFEQRPVFEWTATAGVGSYEIFVRSSSGDIRQSGLTGTTWTPSTDLAPGPIRWWIRGVAPSGTPGLWSLPVVMNIVGRTTVLTPFGSTTDTTPAFSWQTVTGAVRYELYVERLGEGQALRENSLTETSFTPAAPLALGNYRVWVKAISSLDNVTGIWSDAVVFTIV
ncbi:MAG: hypothetical protein R3C19_10710 [Planctomycetaceae bacterium]